MRLKDLRIEDIKVGLRIKSLSRDTFGTIVSIDKEHDDLAWVQWDDKDKPTSGFYIGSDQPENEVISE